MSHKQHRHQQNKQAIQHSTELKLTIRAIAFIVRLEAWFFLVIGLLVLVISLSILIGAFAWGGLSIGIGPPLIGIIFLSLGIAMLKVASSFETFEPWAYPWVEFLTQTWQWSFGTRSALNEIRSTDVRNAFNQPEYQYPGFPEYGTKIEDIQDSKSQNYRSEIKSDSPRLHRR